MTAPTVRLMRRLKEECGIEAASIYRTYAGRLQKSQAAWSWFALDAQGREGREVCGGYYTVSQTIRAKQLHVEADFFSSYNTWRSPTTDPLPVPGLHSALGDPAGGIARD